MVVRHGRWYLLCWAHRTGAQRAYRIDRVRGVEVLEASFEPPGDLDPVALLDKHLAVGWEYDIEVIIDAPVRAVEPRLPRALGQRPLAAAELGPAVR